MINKLFYLSFFILLLVLFRIIPHPPNFTPIIASSIMAPMMLNSRIYGMLIPVTAMFISEYMFGIFFNKLHFSFIILWIEFSFLFIDITIF